MDVREALYTTRAMRRVKPDPIPADVQARILDAAIRALTARSQPLVAILWGRDASTLKPMLKEGNCVAIESPHPSPLSASRGFFGSRPFSRANELLAGMGAEPIDWRLP